MESSSLTTALPAFEDDPCAEHEENNRDLAREEP